MRIAIASGKGGTGKTLISTSLVALWSEQGWTVTYVDADAEEPNGHLFLKPEISMEMRFSVWIPVPIDGACRGHGKCQEICAFNAILAVKDGALVFKTLCHSCRACILACPEKALKEEEREIGTIAVGKAGKAMFVSGLLDVGEARVTPLISRLIEMIKSVSGIVVVDAPPGTSCPVIAAVRGADLLVLVTEPTPFGLHDLKIAVEMGRTLGIAMVAVINRADLGDDQVRHCLQEESIPILAEIPFKTEVAESYARGLLPVNNCHFFRNDMEILGKKLLEIAGAEK